jgi:hypothetical protein
MSLKPSWECLPQHSAAGRQLSILACGARRGAWRYRYLLHTYVRGQREPDTLLGRRASLH